MIGEKFVIYIDRGQEFSKKEDFQRGADGKFLKKLV